jgi:hypothetical protein
MAMLDLLFGGKSFPVPKLCVLDLLKHHQELFQATTYAVQSSVPDSMFRLFVDSLKTQRKITVTRANAVPLWFLSREFFLAEVAAECATFLLPIDQFASIPERVSQLERKIESLEEGLESLRLVVEKLREVKGGSEQPPSSQAIPPVQRRPTPKPSPAPASPKAIPTPTRSPLSEPAKSHRKVEIPLKELQPVDSRWDWEKREAIEHANRAKSLDGIISYLTKKHGGNVHEKGIVTITSKSVYGGDPTYALKNVADIPSCSAFYSENEPGQWICWDFREMRVRLTHYTIVCWSVIMKSWVVEGSLDGSSWTEIGNGQDLWSYICPFHASNKAEFRFIRLTQTSNNGRGRHRGHRLILSFVEFFGTLSE